MKMRIVWTMTDLTLVLAKMDLQEMEQFVLVSKIVRRGCACEHRDMHKRAYTVTYLIFFSLDINECVTSDPCDENADCVNTKGTFICTCRLGFTGNGTSCSGTHFHMFVFWLLVFLNAVCMIDMACKSFSDIDECSKNGGPCDKNANCFNNDGSFTCTCKDGFTGNGTVCVGKLPFVNHLCLPIFIVCLVLLAPYPTGLLSRIILYQGRFGCFKICGISHQRKLSYCTFFVLLMLWI